MTKEQEIVVSWMRRIMQERDLTAEAWAGLAGIAPTSITRATGDRYTGTTSLPLLHRLARAADVPSPVDFLAGYATRPGESELVAACTVALGIQPRVTAQELARLLGNLMQRCRA